MYRDDSDKPEMLVALSTFEALCGFMPTNDAVDLLRSLSWSREADFLESNGTRSYMAWAFEQSDTPDMTRVPSWLSRIASLYPADKALRVAPLLNHVVLEKGEALALPAGNLHAYLRGFGLEVMKSSDNVIRAGFTSKHIDVAELLHIVDCTPLTQPKAHLDPNASAEVFTSPSVAFSVGRFDKTKQDMDHHRIVFGIRRDGKPHGTSNELPAAYLLVAGDTDAVDFDDAWVCTQH
jgi:mannose-6-phosphate isomerase